MLAEATEHGYLVITNGQVIAFRYAGSGEETRMARPKGIPEVLSELARAGWTLCSDARRPSAGSGDYELKVERSTMRDEVGLPKLDSNDRSGPPGSEW